MNDQIIYKIRDVYTNKFYSKSRSGHYSKSAGDVYVKESWATKRMNELNEGPYMLPGHWVLVKFSLTELH